MGVGYTIFVRTTDDDGVPDGGSELQITIGEALAAPRAGESINFASGDSQLVVTVSEVEHWFYPDDDGYPYSALIVTADARPRYHEVVQKLRDPDELKRWESLYPYITSASPNTR